MGFIQSRYSKKYLGKGRGISLYTLLANHVAVNAKNIGLNEIDVESMARILEDHVKQRFWSDEGEELNQERVVQSEPDIVH
ncbi:hypothetical protein [Endozoicomonas lisbonensis]|uniref:Transcriptional regulator n=1 Tax=Endozoicomonas lisbonensis TaxID=3120522 RepID=A0ABV2SB56_9GAMM